MCSCERGKGTLVSIKGGNSLSSCVTSASAERIRPFYSLGCSDPGDTGSVFGKCVWDLCSESVTMGRDFS